MIKRLAFILTLFWSAYLAAGTTTLLPQGGLGLSCNAVTTSTSASPGTAAGCNALALVTSGGTLPGNYTWQVITTGPPASVTVNFMGSLDGVTWTQLDTTSSTSGATRSVSNATAYLFLGCVPATLTGGGTPTVTCQISVTSTASSGVSVTGTPTVGHLASFASSTSIQDGGAAGAGTVTGPVSSVAGNLPSFGDTSGIVLADSGTRVAPIFSTAATGVSMATAGTNTAVVGPTTMVTPGANGTYRFVIQIIETAAGSGGTCAAGTVSVDLAYKEADSAVTYTIGANATIPFYTEGSGNNATALQMINGAPGRANVFFSVPREFRAASGVAVSYQVYQNANSNCTTPPVFAARPALYFMGY